MKKIGVVGIPGSWSSERLADALERKTGFRLVIDMAKTFFDLRKGRVFYEDVNLGTLDGLIIKKIGPEYSPDLLDRLEVLRFLSAKGLKVYSDPQKIMRVLDRLSCTVTLRLGDIPMPPTVITEDPKSALEIIAHYRKAVLKPLYSTKARGMVIADASNGVVTCVNDFIAAGNTVMYIQKKIEMQGTKDLGITFLGGEYLATYARVGGRQSWNTSTANGGVYQPYTPSNEIIALARKAQALFELDFTCVDVAETSEGALVFEVSAFGGFRGLLDANGIDAAELYADHVLKKVGDGK
ncbi:MAG: GAK system ATP-grasp enzyme [Nitrospinae bacterium]|nr:GAK system ATP-grasp enzyme [Nitrospinota bacterium]